MRSLGRALGRDNCLSFIEESFVGIRDDFLIDSGNKSSFGLSQIKWLRSSIGILVSAQEVSSFVLQLRDLDTQIIPESLHRISCPTYSDGVGAL